MPPVYNFPTAYQIERIERIKLPRKTAMSPFFDILPLQSAAQGVDLLIWEQGDLYHGFQQWRGLGGKPLTVSRVGSKRFIAMPGYYGEKIVLREDELTRRRSMAALAGAAGLIDISDLVAQAHEQLLDRRLTRIIKIAADLIVNGSFTVSGQDGATVYQGSYTQQQITPSIPWSTLATATPLADMRNYRLLEFGQDVSFTSGGYQLMSSVTANYLLNNENPNDLGGKRVLGGSTLNTLNDINNIFLTNDIPQIRIYNDGYYPDGSTTFTRFLPDGKVIVVGHRLSGAKIGAYRFTANMVSLTGQSAPYTKVRVDDDIPSVVEVHDGHNGGPILQFPGALIKVNAA